MSICEGKAWTTWREFLLHCARQAPEEGIVLEFGVFEGNSMRVLCEAFPDRKIYGFDSFKGLPEHWMDQWPKGHLKCEPPADLPPNAELVVGMFEETLEKWVEEHRSEEVALIHIDCDLESSTMTVFKHLAPLVRPGVVIVFDEFLIGGQLGDEAAAWLQQGIPSEYVAQMAKKRVAVRVIKCK